MRGSPIAAERADNYAGDINHCLGLCRQLFSLFSGRASLLRHFISQKFNFACRRHKITNYKGHAGRKEKSDRRGIIRHPALLILLVSVTLAAMIVVLAGETHPDADEVTACRNNVTSDCLIGTGVLLMSQSRSQRTNTRPGSQLSSLNRFEQAQALYHQFALDSGSTEEAASVTALRATSTHQLLSALSKGLDLDEALVRVPYAHAGNLWLAGLKLLGDDPYGLRPFHSGEQPPPRNSSLVAAMASRIVLWVEIGSPKSSAWELEYAAELRARLGDRAGVLEVLQLMQSNAQSLRLSENVFKVAGVDTVLAMLQRSEESYPHSLLAAAGAAARNEGTEALLSEAFDIFANRKIWPEFGLMERVVLRSADLGYLTHAQSLAERMAALADTTEYPFEVFAHIHTAKSLYLAGAEPMDVKARLDVAESLFPADPSKVVAVGLIGGPMQWENSGLAREARWQIASVAANIGDLDRARRMLDGLDEPVTAWLGIVAENLPVPCLSQLMVFAQEQLQPHDYAYVAGQFARRAATSDRSAQHHVWALEMTRELASSGQTKGERSVQIHTSLARVSCDSGDEALCRQLAASMADEAFIRRDGAALVHAGYLFAVYGLDEPAQ